MFKEISVKEFGEEYNFMNFHDDWAAASADNGQEKNSLTISWGAIGYLWNKPTITVYIHKERYSQHIFDKADYFTVSIFKNPHHKKELGYLGSKSGRDEDKLANCGLTVIEEDNLVYFKEADYVIVGKKMGQTKFDIDLMKEDVAFIDYYKKTNGVHNIYEGEIIKILKNEES